jgi:hypothetical protein
VVQISLVLVSTVTVGAGGAASIEFTGIPQTGTDLLLVLSARSSVATTTAAGTIEWNGLTSGYTAKLLVGTGSAVSTANLTVSGFYLPGTSTTSNTFSSNSFYFPNYTSSAAKSVSVDETTENNATTAFTGFRATLNTNTAAITSLLLSYSTFVEGTTASLYTITKA